MNQIKGFYKNQRIQEVQVEKFVENNLLYGNLILMISACGIGHWYLNIRQFKKDSIKKINVTRSLHLTSKEHDINSLRLKEYAKKILSEIKVEHYKQCDEIFDDVDMKFVNRQMSIGRISEDKFKNLMMYNGYEVLSPVEDIWGYDFVLKKGLEYHTVQCKCTSQKAKSFPLVNKKNIKYKTMVSHMAFIHLRSSEIYYIPCKDLPDTRSITISDNHFKYKIGLDLVDIDSN